MPVPSGTSVLGMRLSQRTIEAGERRVIKARRDQLSFFPATLLDPPSFAGSRRTPGTPQTLFLTSIQQLATFSTANGLKRLDRFRIIFACMKATLRHPKARGELTEIRFLLLAAACGLIVCKPWGEIQPFDFIVYCKRTKRSYRVQVKSSVDRYRNGYTVSTKRCNGRAYGRRDIDFLAAYVIPQDAWYIIPNRALAGRTSIYVYPRNPESRGMFAKYRDSWQLLSQ